MSMALFQRSDSDFKWNSIYNITWWIFFLRFFTIHAKCQGYGQLPMTYILCALGCMKNEKRSLVKVQTSAPFLHKSTH